MLVPVPNSKRTVQPDTLPPNALRPSSVSGIPPVVAATRLPVLDVLRGLALVLMVADHSLSVLDLDQWRILTRPALPLFMVVSGYLFRGIGPRYALVVLAAALSWYPVFALELEWLHILAVYALVVPFLLLPLPWLALIGSALMVVGYEYPMSMGYEPGYVLAFLILGRFLRVAGLQLPALRSRPLEVLGRYPLTVYVGHVWLLWWWVLVVPTTFISTENLGAL